MRGRGLACFRLLLEFFEEKVERCEFRIVKCVMAVVLASNSHSLRIIQGLWQKTLQTWPYTSYFVKIGENEEE